MMSPSAVAKKSREFEPEALLATIGEGRKAMLFPKKRTIFAQGNPADAVFYLQAGKKKHAGVSKNGKKKNNGKFRERRFFGEGSLAGPALPHGASTPNKDCFVLR